MSANSDTPLVLVVDDNEMNIKLMKGLIAYAGYRLEVALSAEEALKKAAQIEADIVLMDIQLPGMDGYEATRELRKQTAYQSVPILAISGYALEQNEVQLRDAGFSGFLQKPINVQNVLATLKHYLSADPAG